MRRPRNSRLALLVAAGLIALPAHAEDFGFSISVDGEHVAGDPVPAEVTRKTDIELAITDIQVKFDGLDVKPVLNLQPLERRRSYAAGEAIPLLATTNYPAFISRGEIVILDTGVAGPLQEIAVLPVRLNGTTSWTMPTKGSGDFAYILRVYDVDGRRDETYPLPLIRATGPRDLAEEEETTAPGWSEDNTASRSISVFGGGVTVYGTDLPEGAQVMALGEMVPVDPANGFLIQRILPPGDHDVSVAVAENGGAAMQFDRDINIPADEWFYVGMADLTVGHRWGSGELVAADPSEFDGVYVKGRTAFYLKGKIKGEYLLTASADTGEAPIEEMFTGILSKDPQEVLRRIDPDEFYPVYGDGSTTVDDAPTRGKLYVRLERGPSHVMWGNFRTQIGGSAFVQGGKAVYGASAVYQSDQVTTNGEARFGASAYAAHPGALTERDVMRGTGGSAYFLRRQDVVRGSETLVIETRNATTGLVTNRQSLVQGTDYRINYMQGVIILDKPLRSGIGSGGVGSPTGSSEVVELVAEYEYVPINPDLEDYSVGGRGEGWINDHVRIGATALAEKNDDGDVTMVGGDIRLQATPNTFFAAEVMRSEGTGNVGWVSTDGGLTYVQQARSGLGVDGAYAFRLNGQADLSDLGGNMTGVVGAVVEGKQAGFWSQGSQAQADQLVISTFAALDIDEATRFKGQYDQYLDAEDKRRGELSAEIARKLDPFWEIAVSAGYLDRFVPGEDPDLNGRRLDLGVRVTYEQSEDLSIYAFGRATAWRTAGFPRNDRIGAGLEWTLSEAWSAGAELSYGTSGVGGMAVLDFHPDPNHRSYFGYRLNPDYDDDFDTLLDGEKSGFVMGTEHRYSDILSVYAENNSSFFDSQRSSTNTYGVTYTPDAYWRYDGALEIGRVEDPDASDFDRQALSLGGGYSDEVIKAALRGEVRLEDSADNSRDRQTYLLQGGVNWHANSDWTVQTNFDAAISNSDLGLVMDGDFVKANFGLAYRPVENDRLNLLMRYTFLYDLPGPNQVVANGATPGPAQRSHVFSIDANYDLTPQLTIGGKYGFRLGETSLTRDANDFTASTAHLAIARVDAEILKNLDLILDGRVLYMPDAGTTDYGAVTSLYYGINDNLKVGAGYNWGKFSDDLTDQTFDDQGVFFNVLGKY